MTNFEVLVVLGCCFLPTTPFIVGSRKQSVIVRKFNSSSAQVSQHWASDPFVRTKNFIRFVPVVCVNFSDPQRNFHLFQRLSICWLGKKPQTFSKSCFLCKLQLARRHNTLHVLGTGWERNARPTKVLFYF